MCRADHNALIDKKIIDIGGQILSEVAMGWNDLSNILKDNRR